MPSGCLPFTTSLLLLAACHWSLVYGLFLPFISCWCSIVSVLWTLLSCCYLLPLLWLCFCWFFLTTAVLLLPSHYCNTDFFLKFLMGWALFHIFALVMWWRNSPIFQDWVKKDSTIWYVYVLGLKTEDAKYGKIFHDGGDFLKAVACSSLVSFLDLENENFCICSSLVIFVIFSLSLLVDFCVHPSAFCHSISLHANLLLPFHMLGLGVVMQWKKPWETNFNPLPYY